MPPVLERRFHESGASSAAAFKHRVGRSAYEIQNKIDQKVEEELEIARENELDEHLATVKRMKRMNQRLMRVEKMLCKVVGVPYVEEEEDKSARLIQSTWRRNAVGQAESAEGVFVNDATSDDTEEFGADFEDVVLEDWMLKG